MWLGYHRHPQAGRSGAVPELIPMIWLEQQMQEHTQL